MTHGEPRCVEIPETIKTKRPSVTVFYCHIHILLAGWQESLCEYFKIETTSMATSGQPGSALESEKMQGSVAFSFFLFFF